MDDVKDMLRAVINGQHALRKELLDEIAKLRNHMEERFQLVDKGFESVNKRLDSIDARLDKQGSQLSSLEDDTPTRKEHIQLEKRVTLIEQAISN